MKLIKLLPVLVPVILFIQCGRSKSGSSAVDSASFHDTVQTDTAKKMLDVGEEKLPETVKILYGTDRKRINSPKYGTIYGDLPANSISTKYEVGYTLVSVPPNHRAGQIETPSIWKLEFHEDTMKHMVQKNITRLSDNAFDKLLHNANSGQDAFIFVHGFNNSFKDAALRTAQLAVDIHLPIAPIMFSWSSNGKSSDYSGDEENVQLAIPAFKDFLKRVARNGNYKKIHIIAHSMGNRLISMALSQMTSDTANLKIDQIIMAAPDVFYALFTTSYADALAQKAKHVTVYAAKNDWALLASKKIHAGNIRLGGLGVPPPSHSFKNIDIIDANKQKLDFLGHDRFARSPVIINDMDLVLKSGANAQQRHIPYKRFGGDYYYYFN
jgi:esterase/lipase superfamily enzyme